MYVTGPEKSKLYELAAQMPLISALFIMLSVPKHTPTASWGVPHGVMTKEEKTRSCFTNVLHAVQTLNRCSNPVSVWD